MVSIARLSWLQSLILRGHSAQINLSMNRTLRRHKLKVIIEKVPGNLSDPVSVRVLGDFIMNAHEYIIVDKGHSHHDGKSVCVFYCTRHEHHDSTDKGLAEPTARQKERVKLDDQQQEPDVLDGCPGFQGSRGPEGLQGSQVKEQQQLQQRKQPLKSILKKVPSRNVQAEQNVRHSPLPELTGAYTAGSSEEHEGVGGLEDRGSEWLRGFEGSRACEGSLGYEGLGDRRPLSEESEAQQRERAKQEIMAELQMQLDELEQLFPR
eukprot:TRINITY_DN11471_c0_g3_i1.p1 TRINITY_DN11471_c0_g3~~TRINITY_DN11471_c0_g3_i1.p1  ORF type:complete len:264 (+),score=50.44 TRINITY_DN11471_c0_g3_i1:122-913(+)